MDALTRRLAWLLLVVVLASGGCAARKRVGVTTSSPTPSAVPIPSPASGPRLVRVGLVAGEDVLRLGIGGATDLLAGDDRSRRARAELGETLLLSIDRGAVTWRLGARSGRAADALVLRPVDPSAHLVWDERPYAGEFRILARADGLTLVNVVEVETYLRGVVPWEIGRPGRDALAALEAQAVAARTYLASHLGAREALGFDVWAGVSDQVYRGLHGVDDWCDRAIAATAGRVLRFEGREIEAYYSSTCGGRSSRIEEVWSQDSRPYLGSRRDVDPDGRDWCADSPQYRWTTEWSAADLERSLAETLPDFLDWLSESPRRRDWNGTPFQPARPGADARRPGRLRSLEIVARTTSDRVAVLELHMDSGVYRVRGDRTRWVLAPVEGRFSILRSAAFTLKTEYATDGSLLRVLAEGRGFGHGIGLCQTGALGMARAGRSVEQILAHYYPGARLEALDGR